MKYRVRNWELYQHYKDRNPPWIKLHFQLLASEDWVTLDDASRVLAIAVMLVASRNSGAIDGSKSGLEYLKRVAYLNSTPDLKPLVSCGFIVPLADASTLLAFDTQETETETETEVLSVSPRNPDPIPYQAIIEHLNLKTGRNYRHGTGAHRRLIKARWNDGHRLEDFKRVIDTKAAKWAGTEQDQYLRPETLFGTKFDSYLQEGKSNGGVQVPRETYATLEFEFAEDGHKAAEAWIVTQPTAYHDKLRARLTAMTGGHQ